MRVKMSLFFFFILFFSGCTGHVHKSTPSSKKPFRSPSTHFPYPQHNVPAEKDYTEFGEKEYIEREEIPSQDITSKEISSSVLVASMISGVWNVSLGEISCRIATPQTRYNTGFRAGPLRCPDPLRRVQYWRIVDNQLVFYDQAGDSLLVFKLIEKDRLQASLPDGEIVLLSR